MKILIRFGDNDFINTFRSIAKILLETYRYREDLPKDKEILAEIINNLIIPCYILNQHDWTSNEKNNLNIKTYLNITSKKIYIDDEVDDFLKDGDWFNCEIIVLDTNLDHLNNDPIYTL